MAKHQPDLPVISFDDAREALGLRHGENEGAAAQFAVDRAKSLVREKQPFVWSSTHLSAQMHKKTLDLLYAYQAKVKIQYLEMPKKEVYRHNIRRDTSLGNEDIRRMLFKWEVRLPSEAHQVHYSNESGAL